MASRRDRAGGSNANTNSDADDDAWAHNPSANAVFPVLRTNSATNFVAVAVAHTGRDGCRSDPDNGRVRDTIARERYGRADVVPVTDGHSDPDPGCSGGTQPWPRVCGSGRIDGDGRIRGVDLAALPELIVPLSFAQPATSRPGPPLDRDDGITTITRT